MAALSDDERRRINRRNEVVAELCNLLAEFDGLCLSTRIMVRPIVTPGDTGGITAVFQPRTLTDFGTFLAAMCVEDKETQLAEAMANHPSSYGQG